MNVNFLSLLFGRPRRPSGRRSTSPPCVEPLETRDVPTVVFNPAFGAEAVSGPNEGMISPQVNLIFSGPYWSTAQGKQDEGTLLNSARNILSGPYLSGLTQYGSDGHAVFRASWDETATVPSQPSTGELQWFLESSIIKHNAAPGFLDTRHAPIFVVVSDPASANQYNGAGNAPGAYFD